MAYSKSIVGRHEEQDILSACVSTPKAEFIAVYGRRRVGKTYLIKQHFKNKFDFYTSGIYKISNEDQLENFRQQLLVYGLSEVPKLKNWFEAFAALRRLLEGKRKSKRIVFIDELPWHDAPRSNFLRALESFWNMWAADQQGLKLIVCGSSATWMTNTLLGDKGGLHNRVTRRIKLHPFTLAETETYLKRNGFLWNRFLVLQCYMAVGGTPYYLSMLQPDQSVDQNIDRLFFAEDAELKNEYSFLFRSLFNDATGYRRVVETLAQTMKGMTREELVNTLKISDNGQLTKILDNLCSCDFIRKYSPFGKKNKGTLYQLTDLYALFYLRFVNNYHGGNPNAWSGMNAGVRNAWLGYAFEQVCLGHILQIRKSLGISVIANDVSSWYCKTEEQTAQIDLILDRADNIINLCEMKFCSHSFEITKQYAEHLRERIGFFADITRTRKALHLTMVTTFGVKKSKHSSIVQNEVTMDDLFAD